MFTIICPYCLENSKYWTIIEAMLWIELHDRQCQNRKEFEYERRENRLSWWNDSHPDAKNDVKATCKKMPVQSNIVQSKTMLSINLISENK